MPAAKCELFGEGQIYGSFGYLPIHEQNINNASLFLQHVLSLKKINKA